MKSFWVIANRDNGTNRLCYYTGKYTFHGDMWLGDVLEAKRFASWAELIDFLSTTYDFDLGFSVIEIMDVTFEKLEESKAGDRDLYSKFHDPNYAIR